MTLIQSAGPTLLPFLVYNTVLSHSFNAVYLKSPVFLCVFVCQPEEDGNIKAGKGKMLL
jgi:hypothetical protein